MTDLVPLISKRDIELGVHSIFRDEKNDFICALCGTRYNWNTISCFQMLDGRIAEFLRQQRRHNGVTFGNK